MPPTLQVERVDRCVHGNRFRDCRCAGRGDAVFCDAPKWHDPRQPGPRVLRTMLPPAAATHTAQIHLLHGVVSRERPRNIRGPLANAVACVLRLRGPREPPPRRPACEHSSRLTNKVDLHERRVDLEQFRNLGRPRGTNAVLCATAAERVARGAKSLRRPHHSPNRSSSVTVVLPLSAAAIVVAPAAPIPSSAQAPCANTIVAKQQLAKSQPARPFITVCDCALARARRRRRRRGTHRQEKLI
jgi:hypothetical protein